MLLDSHVAQKRRIKRQDFLRCVAAVKIAQQSRNTFDDGRIRVGAKITALIAEFRNKPKIRETAFNLELVRTKGYVERRLMPPKFYKIRQPTMCIRNARQIIKQVPAFFWQSHDHKLIAMQRFCKTNGQFSFLSALGRNISALSVNDF